MLVPEEQHIVNPQQSIRGAVEHHQQCVQPLPGLSEIGYTSIPGPHHSVDALSGVNEI